MPVHGSIDNVNAGNLPIHVKNMPSINSSTYYIGGAFIVFFHVEDEEISSISYLRTGAPKIWYVVLSSSRVTFQTFV